MSRALRIEFPGAIYHMMARGVARMPVFRDDEDRLRLLLEIESQIKLGWLVVYAFCLMLNHIHLLCMTPYAGMSRIMHDILGNYASRHNRRHERVGHLWQGRYKAILVQDGDYLLGCSRYIHVNPREAGIDSPDFSYPWSSCQNYLGEAAAFPWVCTDRVLACLDGSREYRAFLEDGIQHVENPFEAAIAGIVYGDSAFAKKICRQAKIDISHEAQPAFPLLRKLEAVPTSEAVRSAIYSAFPNASDCQIRRYLVWALRVHARLKGSEICRTVDLKRSAVSEIFQAIEKRRLTDCDIARRLDLVGRQIRGRISNFQ